MHVEKGREQHLSSNMEAAETSGHHTQAVTAKEVIIYGPQGLNFAAKTPEILEAL